jgi:type II secretory pathway pseudopilin PulG
MRGVIRRQKERGDTIIEVLFAITVFSLLAVGSMAVMNQGTAAAQRSLELTLVRQQIDSQAEALRYLQASYVAAFASSIPYTPTSPAGQWAEIVSSTPMGAGATSYGTCTPPTSAFAIDTQAARVKSGTGIFAAPDTYARVLRDASGGFDKAAGIWIEAVKSTGFNNPAEAPYLDFHIRACWDGPGLEAPMTTGTIVRLYEPRA